MKGILWQRQCTGAGRVNMALSGLVLLLILYIIWDVNYFIRFVFTVVLGKLFGKKTKLTETTTIYGKPLTHSLTHLLSFVFIYVF